MSLRPFQPDEMTERELLLAIEAVLERSGFQQEGILRRWYPSEDGLGVDCTMYGMTKDDYEDVKTGWI